MVLRQGVIMMVITMANWQVPKSHIFTRWDFVTTIKVGNAVIIMIIVMRTMTMMSVMMLILVLILVLTWSIQQAAEARSEYTAGKPA